MPTCWPRSEGFEMAKTAVKKPPRKRPLVLSNAGPMLSLGHKSIPPVVCQQFGPPKFTPEEQAANPDQPMTRLVKDVLRLGKWKVGMDAGRPVMWDVQPVTLNRISNFLALAQSRGFAMNLTKSHGDLATGIVPTDDLISPLDQSIVDDGVLWVATYVTPEQARYLTNPARKVSPYIFPDWVDGMGNSYPEMLLHVAVTDQPVLPGQGPFVAMANTNSKGAVTMDLATLLPLINELLSAAGGPQIPEDADETNIVGYLKMAISMVTGSEPEAEEPDDGSGEISESGEGSAVPDMGATMSNKGAKAPAWATGLMNTVKALSNTVNQLQEGTVLNRKTAYVAKLAELAATNKITPVQRTHLEKQGQSLGYALSNLAVFELNAAQPQQQGGKAAKVLANPAAPTVDGDKSGKMSAEDHAESLKKRGLKPVELH